MQFLPKIYFKKFFICRFKFTVYYHLNSANIIKYPFKKNSQIKKINTQIKNKCSNIQIFKFKKIVEKLYSSPRKSS